MTFDRQKFKRLVHYIVWKAGRRDWFGATKLNKVLWFAEARHFLLTGKAITGATYIRQRHGPVPKALMPVRNELVKEGLMRILREGKLTRLVADTRPDMAEFTPRELQTINWWIDHVADEHTAETISDLSHDYAWEIAAMDETLPLHASLAVRVREPKGKELEWAEAIAAKIAP